MNLYKVPVVYQGNYLTPTDEWTAAELVQRGQATPVFLEVFCITCLELAEPPKPSGKRLKILTEKQVWRYLKDRNWIVVDQ